jgi:hypothetical protein
MTHIPFSTLPKRAFASEEERQAFRPLLERKDIPLRPIGKKGWLL